jgi:hypothetical protein
VVADPARSPDNEEDNSQAPEDVAGTHDSGGVGIKGDAAEWNADLGPIIGVVIEFLLSQVHSGVRRGHHLVDVRNVMPTKSGGAGSNVDLELFGGGERPLFYPLASERSVSPSQQATAAGAMPAHATRIAACPGSTMINTAPRRCVAVGAPLSARAGSYHG